MIPFNIPPFVGNELIYIQEAIQNHKICGDGEFTKKVSSWIEKRLACNKVLLTTSCTMALEMSAILCDIKEGDEVIMPSYTFVSTANAFVLRGAKIVFVDVRPDTMNIDENLIECAITNRTKAIVPVHYAGVACEMDKIMQLANKYNLFVIEDAAQGVLSSYNGQALGSIGHFGCFSFHETKNYSMGEGGALLLNDKSFIERAEIIREKGTNRSLFVRGQVDKYTWVDIGSSYLPSDLNCAYLYAQLEKADEINNNRLHTWNMYNNAFKKIENKVELPVIPDGCEHNAHMYHLKCSDINERTKLIAYLKDDGIFAMFHYIPLHSAPAGIKFSRFHGQDQFTTADSERLVRLPMYYGIKEEYITVVIERILNFYA